MKRTKKVYIDPLISCYPWAVKLNALHLAQNGYAKAERRGASENELLLRAVEIQVKKNEYLAYLN